MQTKISLLTICFIVIVLFTIYYFYLLYKDNKKLIDDEEHIEVRKIKDSNKILFYKLKKQYLNNISIEDIEDLVYFLENELENRRSK